ncbi:MAG: hypothetical protein ACI8WB_003358 [Phenylobacterium sp.]|jgi:hypothetical protein
MLNQQDIYLKLLQPQHFDALEQLMKAQNVHEVLNVTDVSWYEREGFPYILLKIDTEQIFAAQMVGLNLSIDEILPEYTEPYYLPVISMANGYDAKISKLINHDNAIKHELIHVKDILALIDKDDTYLPRITQYSLNKLTDSTDLSKSIAIEVFKIFYLDPPAFASDFDNGEKSIRTQFLGQIMSYECQTKEEYIEMQISDYIDTLNVAYQQKFPDQKKRIDKKINNSVMKYGKDVLGESPLEKLDTLKAAYPEKILGGMMNNFSVGRKP